MTGILILLAAIAIALISTGEGFIALLGFFVLILGYAGTKWVERYVLYVIKAGQIFSLTEYIKTGQTPVTESWFCNRWRFWSNNRIYYWICPYVSN